MDSASLSYKTLKNVSYSLVGYVWPIVFSIFVTPIVLHRLGLANYGIYVLVNTIIGFLTLLDLGLASALIKYIAEYQAAGNEEGLRKLLNSAHTLYLFIAFIGLAVFLFLGKFFLPIFHITGMTTSHIFVVFALAGAAFFVITWGYVYAAVPAALQRYDITTKLSMFQLTFFNLGMLALVIMGFQLKAIMTLYLFFNIILVLVFRYYFKQLLPGFELSFGWDRKELKKSYRFGVFAAITNLSATSLFQLDRFLIPIFLGPALLTYYTLPGNVAQKVSGVSSSLTQVLFPLSSSLFGSGEQEKVGMVYRRTVRNLAVVAAAGSTACVLFAYPILLFWLGRDFADQGWKILIILAATHYLLSLYSPVYFCLMGLGKSKFLMYLSLFLAVVNIAFLIILVPHYGIVGAAWAYLAGVLPIPFLAAWVEQKYLGLKGIAAFYLKLYAKLFFTAGAVYVLVRFVLMKFAVSLYSLMAVGLLSAALYLLFYKLFGFMETEDWVLLKSFILKIKQKVIPVKV